MDLAPFATAVQPFLYATQDRPAGARISSAHIDYTGLPGMLRVAGFTTSLPEHFFNSIHFVDPKLSTEAALYASGLHLEDTAKHIAVKNISEVPIAVYGTVYPASGAQGGKSLPLPSISLAPGQSSELDLSGITGAEKFAGAAMKVVSSAGPASIIASFTSIESGHGMARSVPFIDSSDPAALTGGYHWRIDGEYTSVISVTNVGATRSAIAGFIRPNGGKDFKIGTRYLEPSETVIFNIKNLRDEQVSDSNGIKLPKAAIAGQFEWSAILGDGSERLIGSADVSNPSLSVSIPDYRLPLQLPSLRHQRVYRSRNSLPSNWWRSIGHKRSAVQERLQRRYGE
jgi:hypothetical protein